MKFGLAVLWAFLALVRASAADVGFQKISVPDPQGKPVAVALWYPSSSKALSQSIGLFQQEVASDGAIAGTALPIVFVSHGTAGSLASHYDTAHALAKAGFIVAAMTYTGDNSQDQTYAGNRIDLVDRPRQLKRVISFVLDDWKDHGHIDPNRLGVFGFSLGAFTTLVEIGGLPDLSRMAQLCRERPAAPECAFIKQRHGDQLDPIANAPTWAHDSRIKAAVIAAPAASYLFGPGSLKNVTIPVQLWQAADDQQAPNAWNSSLVRDGLPVPPELHVVPNAGHYAFLPPCSDSLKQVAPSICTDAPAFDRSAFHQQFNRDVVAFFATTLRE